MRAETLRQTLSSVELYRRGQLEGLPYRWSDPLDLAIWCALVAYVDNLEVLDLESDGGSRPGMYEGMNSARLSARTPAILEMYMNELKAWDRGEREMTREGIYQTALYVLEALFAPPRELSGRASLWGSGNFSVPRMFWETEEREQQGDTGVPAQASRSHEPPIRFPERLLPLFALIKRALGELVTQSEAARRLGITSRSVSLRVERGELRSVRVGGQVLIPEEDVGTGAETRLRI